MLRFPRALNKQKLLTKNVLLSDESNNERCSKRVTGHGQAHAMPITRSLMQTCRVACSVYNNRRTREEKEKEKKAKEQIAKRPRGGGGDGGEKAKEQQGPSCLWRGGSESKRTEKKSISKEQKKYKEELQVAGRQYVEENRRLQKVIKDQNRGGRDHCCSRLGWRW